MLCALVTKIWQPTLLVATVKKEEAKIWRESVILVKNLEEYVFTFLISITLTRKPEISSDYQDISAFLLKLIGNYNSQICYFP